MPKRTRPSKPPAKPRGKPKPRRTARAARHRLSARARTLAAALRTRLAASLAPRRRRLALAIAAPALLLAAAILVAIRLAGDRPVDTDSGAPRTQTASAPPPPAPRPTDIVTLVDGCLTSECHQSLTPPAVAHEPVAEQACDVCHAPDTGGHVYPLTAEGDALCTQCHETSAGAPVQHAALSAEGCLACHDAHASAAPMLLAAANLQDVCRRCHAPAAGAHAHPPYRDGDCGACHEPHGSIAPGLLRGGAGIDHCAMCHADTIQAMASSDHSHAGIEGECQACHGAHATAHPALLIAPVRDTCTACHEDVGETVTGAMVSHDAVLGGDQCLSCHAPHESSNARMLRDSQTAVCMACHDKTQQATDGREIPAMAAALAEASVLHGPVEMGACSECHSVHGGAHTRLLRELSPEILLGEFDIRNYALCFSCHEQSLVLEDSASATAFRHGETNLHRVHISSNDRSKSCASCHAVHAAGHPRLIAEQIAYDQSDWIMAMNFEITADGGSCAPGCHEALGYSRLATPPTDAAKEGGAP